MSNKQIRALARIVYKRTEYEYVIPKKTDENTNIGDGERSELEIMGQGFMTKLYDPLWHRARRAIQLVLAGRALQVPTVSDHQGGILQDADFSALDDKKRCSGFGDIDEAEWAPVFEV